MDINTKLGQPKSAICDLLELKPTTTVSLRATYQKFYNDGFEYIPVPTRGGAVLVNERSGSLMLEVWTAHRPQECLISTAFDISHDSIRLFEVTTVEGWQSLGLVEFLITMAQGLTGWSRALVGMDRISYTLER